MIGAGSVVAAAPAYAIPGEASAIGALANLTVNIPPVLINATSVVGDIIVNNPGSDSSDLVNVDLVDDPLADVTLDVVSTEAVSDASGSSASASVEGASFDLFGISLFTLDTATADVVCTVGEVPTAVADVANLTVLGEAATVEAGVLGAASGSVELGAGIGGADLTGLILDVSIAQVEEVVGARATSISLLATVTLSGELAGEVFPPAVLGTILLAGAECETPAVVPVTTAAITPAVGPTTGGQTVTITGSGFLPDVTTVNFGATPATAVTVAPDGASLTAVTPAGTAGPVTVTVANPGSSATLGYTYVAPNAALLSPDSGPEEGGTEVTITGQGLNPTTAVTFGGVPATNVVASPDGTQVVATAPPGTGVVDVALTVGGGSTVTLADAFTYIAPSVISIAPESGPDYGGTTVTITGEGLDTTTGVTFGGGPAAIVSVSPDGTQVVVTTPAGTGLVDVVLTREGGETLTEEDAFTYVAPAVTDLSPEAGSALGGTTVTITGSGLAGTTGVLFGGAAGTIVGTPTDTEVVVTTPAGAAGPVDVTIQLPGEEIVIEDGFLYVAVPVADRATPRQGPTTGGTVVTVTGSGFIPGATTVTICGVVIPSGSVNVNAAGTSLTFTTPACGTAGVSGLVVNTPGGSSANLGFRYIAATPSGGGGGSLPATGGTAPGPMLLVSLGLLVAGVLTVAGTRRRHA